MGWPVAAGRRRAGDGGEGVMVAAVFRWVGRGSGRRREVGGARGRRVDLARWVEQGTAAAPGADEKPSVRGKGEGGRKYMGGPFVPGEATTRDKRAFCPGSWLHPGQKVFLGGPGKFPARGPPFVPGGSTTRDKRGPFSLVPA